MKSLLYLLLLLCSGLLYSQKNKIRDTSAFIFQPERIEFGVDDYGTMDYQVINGEEDGLLVTLETENRTKDGYNWTFYSVDTLLNIQWSQVVVIPFEGYLTGTEYHNGKFYLLYNVSRYRTEDLLLFEINATSGEISKMEITTVFPVQLTFFEVLGANVIFGGYTNYRPVVLTYDLNDQRPKVVPGFYDNNSDILDIVIDDDALMFTVVQSERMNNRKFTVRTKTFTSSGDLIQSNTIAPGEKKNLIDGASTIFYGGFQYVAGTFSKKNSQYSRGLYLSKFVNGRQQFVKYHDYAELTNFFGFMNERREQRIKQRIERKMSKGKKARFSYRLLVHDIIQRGDEYLMIAEAYYPRYSSYSNSSSYRWAGIPGMNPNFLGFKYTHAVVVSFDRNGNILWDNSFEINDIDTYALNEFVAVDTYDDKVILMYLEENTIRSKVIQGDKILEGKTFSPVRLAFEDDEIKTRDPEIEGLQFWYKKTMYAFGEQRIRNESGVGGRYTRKVFYINKIRYSSQLGAN